VSFPACVLSSIEYDNDRFYSDSVPTPIQGMLRVLIFDKSSSPSLQVSEPEPTTAKTNQNENNDTKPALPLWQPFNLDATLLKGLRAWNDKHANERLPDILNEVTHTIESRGVQFALDLIPNDPFPAGTLVKSLVDFALLWMVCPHHLSSSASLRRSSRTESTGTKAASLRLCSAACGGHQCNGRCIR
jgi:hypothetical protein